MISLPNCTRTTVLLSALLWLPSPAAADTWQEREQQRIESIADVAPSVVCVMPPTGEGGGSGVLVSADGYTITNFHVVSEAGSFFKCGLNDGRVYDAVLVGIDPAGDVAMIQILGRDDFPFAIAGDSDKVKVGDEVMALGNPFLLADEFSPTITYGIVSGIHRYQYPAGMYLEYTDCIQIDASINPGNSGGPLFDVQGKWIGINGRASFEQRGRVNVGAAYAISVRQVQLFLEHLRSGRIVDHGNAEFSAETDSTGRVVVAEVSEISEAVRRDLQPGDELVSFAGRALTSANDFKNILGIFPSGIRVPITFRNRDGLCSTTIRLRPLHEFEGIPQQPPDLDSQHDTPAPTIPSEYAHLFESRPGFANYAFNRRHQQRLVEPLEQSLNRFERRALTWNLSLTANDNDTSMNLVIGASGAGLSRGRAVWHQNATDLDPAAEPDDYPGLLTAVVQWHRLFRGLRDAWPESIYIGAETHLPTNEYAEVLETFDGPVVCRWLFRDDSPFPFGVDVETGAGIDEARLLFDGWSEGKDVPVPSRLGIILPDTGQITWLGVDNVELRE